MVRGKTRQRRLDDVSLFVLAGILVNKSIRTTGRYRGSKDAFSLFTFPFTWFVADAERLDGTCCDGCTDGLLHFFLALAAGTLLAAAGAAARSATAWRRRNRVRLAMPVRATTVIIVIILGAMVTVSSMMATVIIPIVVAAVRPTRTLLDSSYAGRMPRVSWRIAMRVATPVAVAVAPVVVVVGRVLAAGDGVVTTSAGDDVHGALVGRGVAIAGWIIVAVVVCHFLF